MERIRDFLYDISDLLISLVIIAAIFFVISWKLNESIPIDSPALPPEIDAPAGEQPDVIEPESPEPEPITPDPIDDASDADKPISETPSTEVTAPVTPTPTPAPTPAPAAGKAVTIDIPSGSPGVAIGRILKEQGLIADVNAFIQKVDEMGLGPKLRSGTFSLKTGMTLEEIIKILANVK